MCAETKSTFGESLWEYLKVCKLLLKHQQYTWCITNTAETWISPLGCFYYQHNASHITMWVQEAAAGRVGNGERLLKVGINHGEIITYQEKSERIIANHNKSGKMKKNQNKSEKSKKNQKKSGKSKQIGKIRKIRKKIKRNQNKSGNSKPWRKVSQDENYQKDYPIIKESNLCMHICHIPYLLSNCCV